MQRTKQETRKKILCRKFLLVFRERCISLRHARLQSGPTLEPPEEIDMAALCCASSTKAGCRRQSCAPASSPRRLRRATGPASEMALSRPGWPRHTRAGCPRHEQRRSLGVSNALSSNRPRLRVMPGLLGARPLWPVSARRAVPGRTAPAHDLWSAYPVNLLLPA
jgi:hypothetical protein